MKRLFSLVLSLVMLVTIVTAVDLSAYALPDDFNYTAAVTLLKEQMLLRADTAKAVIVRTTDKGGKPDPIDLNELAEVVFDEACSQSSSTGTTDGDYLKWHCKTWQCDASSSAREIGSKRIETITLDYQLSYYTTKEQEDAVKSFVDAFIKDNGYTVSKDTVLTTDDEYERICTIHDFICENTEYDWDTAYDGEKNELSYTAYGALINKLAVCQGYSTLFYRLCKEAGVDCRTVTGEDHMWNIARIGNYYYEVDCTWDSITESSDYLLKGSETIEADHIRTGESATDEFKLLYPVPEDDYVLGETPDDPSDTCADGHTFDDGTVITNPTCVISGITRYTCIECGYTENQVVPKVDHTFVEYVYNEDATCYADGTETAKCEVCKIASDTRTAENTKTEHHYIDTVVPPTCLEQGYTIHTCEFCGDSNNSDYVAAKGHNPVVLPDSQPDCVNNGRKGDTVCNDCGVLLEAGAVIPAKGHNYISNVVAASCTTQGYTAHICTVCGSEYKDNYSFSSGHNYVLTSDIQPGCTSGGTKVFTCTNCNSSYSQSVGATGHTVVTDPAVAATYAKAGLTEGSHCAVCGEVINPQNTVAKLAVPKITLSSVKSKKKKEATVTWKKNTKVTGYEIQYTTDKKFKKSVKKSTISKNKTTSATLKKLTAKKTYYVRIRAYKTVGGKKYYSDWSKAKSVKIK